MSEGECVIRPFRPDDREAWLELMADICVFSPAWEAVYLDRPPFNSEFDLVAEEKGVLVGALAGHLIQSKPKSFWSAEVLGVHPDHQKKGIGQSLLREASLRLKSGGDKMVLWTCCPMARDWYLKLGYPEIEGRSLEAYPIERGELHVLKPVSERGRALWAFFKAL